MDNSIENIWNKGFINENLPIPKIEQLYNQKSINSTESIISRFKLEVYLQLPLAALLFIVVSLLDNDDPIIWGILCAIPNLIWYFLGQKQIKALQNIDYKSDCYNYLLSVREKLNTIYNFNKKLAISSIPIILFPTLVYTYYRQKDKTLGELFKIESLQDTSLLYIFLLLPIITLFFYVIAHFAFKKSKTKALRNISTIIKEIETLKE